jgi:hypothetical protein
VRLRKHITSIPSQGNLCTPQVPLQRYFGLEPVKPEIEKNLAKTKKCTQEGGGNASSDIFTHGEVAMAQECKKPNNKNKNHGSPYKNFYCVKHAGIRWLGAIHKTNGNL